MSDARTSGWRGRREAKASRSGFPAVERLEERRLMSAGDIDPTFGHFGDGRVITDFDQLDHRPHALAVLRDNRLLVAGGIFPSFDDFHDQDFMLVRYTANGTLDTTFGDGSSGAAGLAITRFGPGEDVAKALAVRGDGKIIMAGYAEIAIAGNFEFALARYNANGTIDTTFGSGGGILTPFGGNARINAVALLPDNKILAAGFSNNTIAVARYNPNGTLDRTFAGHGKVTTSFGFGTTSFANAMALLPGGKFLLAGGVARAGHESDFALARYNANGTLDKTFGHGGEVSTNLFRKDEATAIAVLRGGTILVAGTSYIIQPNPFGNDYTVHHVSLARYHSNGTPDRSFGGGTGQIVLNRNGPGSNLAVAMSVRPDGKILLAGSETIDQRVQVGRLNANGSLDRTFDRGGIGRVLIGFGGEGNFGQAMGIQSNGRIVVLAQVQPDSRFPPSIGLVRLIGTPPQARARAITGTVFHAAAEGVWDPRDTVLAGW